MSSPFPAVACPPGGTDHDVLAGTADEARVASVTATDDVVTSEAFDAVVATESVITSFPVVPTRTLTRLEPTTVDFWPSQRW